MNELSKQAKKLAELANKNLGQLAGKCQIKNEIQDYYLGILRRQAIMLLDLSKIFENRNQELVTTPYIILRSMLDDFLHILFLELQNDKEEQIVRINAKAHKQTFKSLKELTDSNHKHFNGNYEFYLNKQQFEDLKQTFIGKEENHLDAIIIASGSEVNLAMKAKKVLLEKGIDVRVVSMPCQEFFDQQDEQYKEAVLPNAMRKRLSVEMASSFGWHKYVGLDGITMSINEFGKSAPAQDVIQSYGFTVDGVVENIEKLLK